jgi:hypothetical protein
MPLQRKDGRKEYPNCLVKDHPHLGVPLLSAWRRRKGLVFSPLRNLTYS